MSASCVSGRAERAFVARVTIDRAAKLNALDRMLIGEIIEAMTGLAAEPELRWRW